MNSDEERPEPQYHYMIMRRDMEPGAQMAQAIHAAGETAHWGATHVGAAGESLRLRFDARAVALAARDEAELGNVVRVLRNHDRLHFIVRETDGPHAGQVTAIGVVPGPKLECLRWLPLVR